MGIRRSRELNVNVTKSDETLKDRDMLLTKAGFTNTESELVKLNGLLSDVVSTPARSLKESEHDRLGKDVTEALRQGDLPIRSNKACMSEVNNPVAHDIIHEMMSAHNNLDNRVIEFISKQLLVIVKVQSGVEKHAQSQLGVCLLLRQKRLSEQTLEVCLDNSVAEVQTSTSDDEEVTALLRHKLGDVRSSRHHTSLLQIGGEKLRDLLNREGSVGDEHEREEILRSLVLLQVQLIDSSTKDFIDISAEALDPCEEAVTRLLANQETTSVEGPEEITLGLGDKIVDDLLAVTMLDILEVTRL